MMGDAAMSRRHSLSWAGVRLARAAIITILAVSSLAVAPAYSLAATGPTFVISGAGFGHGVGLSQYGAKGYAETGKTGEWIVAHYYPGTSLKRISGKIIRVNLDPSAVYDKSSTKYNNGYSATGWKIRGGWAGAGISVNGRAALPDSGAPYSFEPSSTKVVVKDKNGKPVAGSPFAASREVAVAMTGTKVPALLQVMGRSGPLKNGSSASAVDVRYRGTLVIRSDGTKLKLLNQLPIEQYLYGVVPRESPASWPREALKAQAMAARSYAYAGRSELYCDTRSQVYNGYSHQTRVTTASKMHEDSRSNAAVDLTRDKYLVYGGKVISAVFTGSSGGYTAPSSYAWGGVAPPYLKGVPDPYGTGRYDPWDPSVKVTGIQVAKALAHVSGAPAGAGTTWWVDGITVDHIWPSGWSSSIALRWTDGHTSSVSSGISGSTVRGALGLPSSKFFVNAQGDRIAGSDRSVESVAASKRVYPSGTTKAIVVASGDDARFAEAACAVALSGVGHGPMLLVNRDSVPAGVAAEIKRLHPAKLYIVGGPKSVSSATAAALHKLGPAVERLSGGDQYATAAAVARRAKPLGANSTKAVVTSGHSASDVAIAAALAGGSKRLLVLTAPSKLSRSASDVLKGLRVTQTILVGGSQSLSGSTVASVLSITKEKKPYRRIGATGSRFDAAVAAANVANSPLGFSRSTVYVASVSSVSDMLIASALSAETRNPFVLTGAYTPEAVTRSYLLGIHAQVTRLTVVGRPTALGLAPGMQLMSDAH